MGICISQAKYRAVAAALVAKIPRNLGRGWEDGPPADGPTGVSAEAWPGVRVWRSLG